MPTELTKSDLIDYSVRRKGATWLDVNSSYDQNGKPLLLPDVQAINNSIYNLLTCPVGARGRIFQPTYGTLLYHLLQEPIDQITASKIRASLVQSLEFWEPRIALDHANTQVLTAMNLPGYAVRVAYYYRLTDQHVIATFKVSA